MLGTFCVCLEEKRGSALLKDVGTGTSLISHVKINSHLHELLEYEMYLASANLAAAHTHRAWFFPHSDFPSDDLKVSGKTPSIGISLPSYFKRGSRKVLEGEEKKHFHCCHVITSHNSKSQYKKWQAFILWNILLSCSSNWTCLGKNARFPDLVCNS